MREGMIYIQVISDVKWEMDEEGVNRWLLLFVWVMNDELSRERNEEGTRIYSGKTSRNNHAATCAPYGLGIWVNINTEIPHLHPPASSSLRLHFLLLQIFFNNFYCKIIR